MRTEFDFSKLRGRIKERLGTEREFANRLGISPQALCNRLSNKTDFTLTEISETIKILEFNSAELDVYFFTPKVQKI